MPLTDGDFFRCSRAAKSAVHGRIWPNFDHFQEFMVVLVTCKMKKIRSKMKVLEQGLFMPKIFKRETISPCQKREEISKFNEIFFF